MYAADRIEEGFAVIETDTGHIEVPVSQLGAGVKEGDILVLSSAGIYETDVCATAARREQIAQMQQKLWKFQ
ncbi:MAG: DUF3006 domain-containing protein [Oscillospiraceae bacterium]|jgi:hypothetical protein|nr:DUF3006 domain-containing protein [Oscillospiraceae bacterium]